MKYEQEHTDSSFILSSLYPGKKTRRITMHEAITRLARRSWTSALIAYVNWRTTAQAFKDFSFLTLLEEVLVLVLAPCYLRGSLWTTGKSRSWVLLCIQVRRYPPRLLSRTTLCCLRIRY